MTLGRACVLVGVAHLVLLCSGALVGMSPWRIPVPEVALLLVIYTGLFGRGGLVGQVLLGVVSGYLADLSSGAPIGLHAFSVGTLGLLARLAAPRVLVATVWQLLVIVYLAAFLHGLVLVGLSGSQAPDGFSLLVVIPEHALLTSLLAPILFALFRRIDRQPQPRLQTAWG